MNATTDDKINFKDIHKMINEFQKKECIPIAIKMKQDYYDRLATEAQRYVNLIEVRDTNMQPINTMYGLKVIIDNNIEKEFEVEYIE